MITLTTNPMQFYLKNILEGTNVKLSPYFKLKYFFFYL